jgi:hypothetical protein
MPNGNKLSDERLGLSLFKFSVDKEEDFLNYAKSQEDNAVFCCLGLYDYLLLKPLPINTGESKRKSFNTSFDDTLLHNFFFGMQLVATFDMVPLIPHDFASIKNENYLSLILFTFKGGNINGLLDQTIFSNQNGTCNHCCNYITTSFSRHVCIHGFGTIKDLLIFQHSILASNVNRVVDLRSSFGLNYNILNAGGTLNDTIPDDYIVTIDINFNIDLFSNGSNIGENIFFELKKYVFTLFNYSGEYILYTNPKDFSIKLQSTKMINLFHLMSHVLEFRKYCGYQAINKYLSSTSISLWRKECIN